MRKFNIFNFKKKEITLDELRLIIEDTCMHYIGKMNIQETRQKLTNEIISVFNQYNCPEADEYEFSPVVLPYTDSNGKINYHRMKVEVFKDGDPF